MTQPDFEYLTLNPSHDQIRELIQDLFVHPRVLLLKWSTRTNQTAQVRIAYPGQHLASLITGVPGSGSAARGEDLEDGSEVKTCSRADQLGNCKDCRQRVLPSQKSCPSCDSSKIERKTDSHWILSMRSEVERDQYLDCVRLLLVLFDRSEDQEAKIRIRAWEVWPSSDRHDYYRWFIQDYWTNNYSEKIRRDLKPSPLNLHPLKYDFHMMNPIPIFEAHVEGDDNESMVREMPVTIVHWVDPDVDRLSLRSEEMPASAVTKGVLRALIRNLTDDMLADCMRISAREATIVRSQISEQALADRLVCIPEDVRQLLPRPSKRPKMTPSNYRRNR